MINVNIYPTDEEFGGDFMKFAVREAAVNLPEWYKKSSSYVDDPSMPHKDKGMTVKRCMPVLDYLSLSINLHLPFAVYSHGRGLNKVTTASSSHHNCGLSNHSPAQVQKMPVPEGFHDIPLKIDFPYAIEAPAGYSALFIPQYPYSGYPFHFIPAIVETDKYKAPVNFPFLILNDFEGKVDAGTLFMKVVFVKREKINIDYKKAGEDKGRIAQYRSLVETFGSGFYRKLRLDQVFLG